MTIEIAVPSGIGDAVTGVFISSLIEKLLRVINNDPNRSIPSSGTATMLSFSIAL